MEHVHLGLDVVVQTVELELGVGNGRLVGLDLGVECFDLELVLLLELRHSPVENLTTFNFLLVVTSYLFRLSGLVRHGALQGGLLVGELPRLVELLLEHRFHTL